MTKMHKNYCEEEKRCFNANHHFLHLLYTYMLRLFMCTYESGFWNTRVLNINLHLGILLGIQFFNAKFPEYMTKCITAKKRKNRTSLIRNQSSTA